MHLPFLSCHLPAARPALPSSTVSGVRMTRAAVLIAMSLLAGCASLAGGGGMAPAASPTRSDGVTVFAAGDIADCSRMRASETGAAGTADLIAAGIALDPASMVLALGDTTYPVGLPAEYNDCYAPTWGRFKSRTLPAPGNHEYYTAGAPGYFGYFGDAAGPAQRGYYSTEVGAWHVLSLNSNLKAAAATAQLAWLTEDLAALRRRTPSGCVLAFWHHPVYSSGGHGNNAWMRGVWQALLEAHVDLVLSAHDHDYERFAPQDAGANRDDRNGIRSFVVGTGGAELSPYTATKPHSEAQHNTSHGVLRLKLQPGGYEWAYLTLDQPAPRDTGSARCHGG